MSWRIVKVFEVVSGFVPHWSLSGKRRHIPAPRSKWATAKPSDGCDRCFSIIETFLQDEQLELERLCREIDQFSESFKTSAHKQYNR